MPTAPTIDDHPLRAALKRGERDPLRFAHEVIHVVIGEMLERQGHVDDLATLRAALAQRDDAHISAALRSIVHALGTKLSGCHALTSAARALDDAKANRGHSSGGNGPIEMALRRAVAGGVPIEVLAALARD